MNTAAIATIPLSIFVGLMILLFIFRIVLSWYPQIESQFPYSLIVILTEPLLVPLRALVPPIGGVDITPVIWVGIFSLVRELLLGQQGILTMMARVQ